MQRHHFGWDVPNVLTAFLSVTGDKKTNKHNKTLEYEDFTWDEDESSLALTGTITVTVSTGSFGDTRFKQHRPLVDVFVI